MTGYAAVTTVTGKSEFASLNDCFRISDNRCERLHPLLMYSYT
jgi:hypothetical protein